MNEVSSLLSYKIYLLFETNRIHVLISKSDDAYITIAFLQYAVTTDEIMILSINCHIWENIYSNFVVQF